MDIDELRQSAEGGNGAAEGILGAHYLFGISGVEIDYAEAFKWLSKAAAKGAYRPIAQLGHMYHHGCGVEKNMAEAVRLYKDSSLRGNSVSARELGRMYKNGNDVDIDPNEAIRWYIVAADNEDFDTESEVVREAVEYLAGIPNIGELLVHFMETDPGNRVRCAAPTMIGMMDITATIPALIQSAENGPASVRSRAVEAFRLLTLCDEDGNWVPDIDRIEGLLLRSMDDPDPAIRASASYSIDQFSDNPEATAKLWAALDDPDEQVRGHAAHSLALMGDPALVPRLDQLLRSTPVAEEYFDAALELGDPSLLPAVLIAAVEWRKLRFKHELEYPGIQEAIDKLSEAEATRS